MLICVFQVSSSLSIRYVIGPLSNAENWTFPDMSDIDPASWVKVKLFSINYKATHLHCCRPLPSSSTAYRAHMSHIYMHCSHSGLVFLPHSGSRSYLAWHSRRTLLIFSMIKLQLHYQLSVHSERAPYSPNHDATVEFFIRVVPGKLMFLFMTYTSSEILFIF